jgi:predicted AAA+ superfamily ATPase
MYIPRIQSALLQRGVNDMPVVTLMGPRQAGKTTLAREQLPNWKYVNLEQLDQRNHASADPRGFLEQHGKGVIIDEVQHVPELLSYIQVRVDELRGNGHYILTGSHNLLMLRQVSQSLAGRTYIQHLPPLSAIELERAGALPEVLNEWIFRGGYPRLYEEARDPTPWLLAYIQTYVERDARQVIDLRNVDLFSKFLQIAAGRIGQLWNQSSVANDVGVDANTINSWMNVLETSYITFRLQPHFENFTKRLVRSNKVYFHDTGLACALLGIRSAAEITSHWARGVLFENAIIADRNKVAMNSGQLPRSYFWRDPKGREVDLLEDRQPRILTEIKSAATITPTHVQSMLDYKALYKGPLKAQCVYTGETRRIQNEVELINWRDYVTLRSGGQ